MRKEIRKVAIIGAGTTGTQIGPLAASFGYEVAIYEVYKNSYSAMHVVFKHIWLS